MNLEHREYEIERNGLGPLCFCGEEIAFFSTQKEGKIRWIEISIYETNGGKFVVNVVGQTTVEGEEPKISVRIHDTAKEVVTGLINKNNGELSKPSKKALAMAAVYSNDIDLALEDIREVPFYID